MPSRRALRASLIASLLTAVPAAAQTAGAGNTPINEAAPLQPPAVQPAEAAPPADGAKPETPAGKQAAEPPGAPPQPENQAQDTPAPPKPEGQPAPTPPTTPPAGTELHIAVADIQIFGGEFDYDPETGLIIVTGSPRAVRGTEEIRATRMIINTVTQQFTAEGNVTLNQAGQIVRTERATYSFAERLGQTEAAKTTFGTYYLEAKELRIERRDAGPFYVARNGQLTTCDKEHPHWALTPRKATLYPGQRWVAEDVGLEFLGHRLFTVNRVSKNIAEEDDDDKNLMPSFGYDSINGPYAYRDFWLRRGGPVYLRSNVQLNTLREPMGGLLASTRGNFQFVGSLFYRDFAPNQVNRNLQVSRLPEVGFVWSNWRTAPRAGVFLGHQVPAVETTRLREFRNKWLFAGQATIGYFRQHQGDTQLLEGRQKSGGRFVAQGQVARPVLRFGDFQVENLRFMARQSVYDTGDAFTVFGTGIGKRFRFGNLGIGINRFDQFTVGNSPFLFDRIELAHEWRPSLTYRTPGFDFGYAVRLDAADLNVFDHIFTVSKLFHCIEPRLTYRVRRQQFMLEIRIPGFSGFNRTKATNPRSTAPEFDVPTDDPTDGP